MDLSEDIAGILRSEGVGIYGFADPRDWETDPLVSANVPPERRPLSIMPDARTVLVFAVPVSRTIVDTAPSIYYRCHYDTLNQKLDSISQRVVMELELLGHRSAYLPRDGYNGVVGASAVRSFFSHKHAAYLAGLGTFGVNSTILTPQYGPRVRFASVLTEAEFPEYGHPMEEELCTECGLCSRMCPKGAIGERRYPYSRIDKEKCSNRSAELIRTRTYPCGRCIAVCPVGKDRASSPTEDAVREIRSHMKIA